MICRKKSFLFSISFWKDVSLLPSSFYIKESFLVFHSAAYSQKLNGDGFLVVLSLCVGEQESSQNIQHSSLNTNMDSRCYSCFLNTTFIRKASLIELCIPELMQRVSDKFKFALDIPFAWLVLPACMMCAYNRSVIILTPKQSNI